MLTRREAIFFLFNIALFNFFVGFKLLGLYSYVYILITVIKRSSLFRLFCFCIALINLAHISF